MGYRGVLPREKMLLIMSYHDRWCHRSCKTDRHITRCVMLYAWSSNHQSQDIHIWSVVIRYYTWSFLWEVVEWVWFFSLGQGARDHDRDHTTRGALEYSSLGLPRIGSIDRFHRRDTVTDFSRRRWRVRWWWSSHSAGRQSSRGTRVYRDPMTHHSGTIVPGGHSGRDSSHRERRRMRGQRKREQKRVFEKFS